MKFKAPIEIQAGISDGDPTNPLGQAGYLLSSDGSNVNWVSPGGLSAETAEAIVQPIKANEALAKGDPLYIVGFQTGQDVNIVAKADSSDPAKMPVVGLADDDYANQAFGTMTAFGSFNGDFDTEGGTENWALGDIIFVKPGGGLTNIKPGGTDLIQNVAIVSRVQQNTGELEVIALGRTNDVPNLPAGRLFVGTAANTSLASDVIYVDDTNDRVGIGTADPSTDLEVSSTGANGIVISKTSNQAQVSGRLFFTNDTLLEGFALFNSSGTLQINSAAVPNDSSGNNKVSIVGSSGNVGIGTTNPGTFKLAVAGSTNIGGNVEVSDGLGGDRVLTLTANGGYFEIGDIDGLGDQAFISGDSSSISISTNQITTLYCDWNNRVGIGTTNPDYKLEVNGTIGVNRTDGIIFAGSAGAGLGNKITSDTQNNFIFSTSLPGVPYTTTPRITILNNGNVGIGTTGPSELLHLSSTGPARLLIEADTDNETETDNAQIILKQDGGAVVGNLGYKTNTNGLEIINQYAAADGILAFGTSNAERMRINYLGNVGIGTTNPDSKLEVASTDANTYLHVRNDSTGSTRLKLSNATDTNANGFQIINNSSNGQVNLLNYKATTLALWTNSSQRLTILSGGNVGIGTTNPNAKLEVAGSIRATGGGLDVGYGNNGTNYVQVGSGRTTNGYAFLDLIGDAEYDDFGFRIIRNNGGPNTDTDILHRGTGDLDLKTIDAGDIGLHTASIQRMIVKSDGDVGIGTTLPQSKLQVNGGVQLANDTAAASASKVGTFRYRTSGNNSYVDMCMQTGASTYAWVNIVTNSW